MTDYFQTIGLLMPAQTNPAEWILEVVDTDFAKDQANALERLKGITNAWISIGAGGSRLDDCSSKEGGLVLPTVSKNKKFLQPFYLLHRNFIKSYRDLIAYWIRVVMYTGESTVVEDSSNLSPRLWLTRTQGWQS